MVKRKTYLENNKVIMSEGEEKAFQLFTIARFILARTPMVLGYADHNRIIDELILATNQLSTKLSDCSKIVESQEWKEIQKILDI